MIIKDLQRNFYNRRFSQIRRALTKLHCWPILFYDTRLLTITFKKLKACFTDILLEVGCGQGTDAILATKYFRSVVAIDISSNALKVAKEVSKITNSSDKVFFVVADADHLPFRDEVFDIVFCKDTLHHVPNAMVTLSEMYRVVRNYGKVAAIEANPLNPQMILIGLIYFSIDKGVFKNSQRRLINIFKEVGFFDVNSIFSEFFPRHLVFEYRSPFCSPIISRSRIMLKFLKIIEDSIHRLSFLARFSNYIIIHGIKWRNIT